MSLKILQHNLRSFRSNKDELENFVQNNNYDIILLSETWTKIEDESFYKINRMKLYFEHGINGYRGVAIAIKPEIKHELVQLNVDMRSVEAICIRLMEENIYLVSIYVPEANNLDIRSDLEMLTSALKDKKTIYAGDFNSHSSLWHSSKDDVRGEIVAEMFLGLNCIFINENKRTKKNNSNSDAHSVIDLTICTADVYSLIEEWDVLNECLGSDHFCIEFKLKVKNATNQTKFKKRLINTNKIVREINSLDISTTADIGEIQKLAKNIIKSSTNTINTKNSPKYWWTEEIEKIMLEKKEAIRLFNHKASTENLLEMNRLTAKVKNLIKKEKKKKKNELIQSINPKTPIKKVWDISKMLNGKKCSKNEFNLVIQDKKYAEEFLKTIYGNEELARQARENTDNSRILNLDDFKKIIGSKRNSAPGNDGISYQILNNLSEEKQETIVEALNEVWKKGQLTECLKEIVISKEKIHS